MTRMIRLSVAAALALVSSAPVRAQMTLVTDATVPTASPTGAGAARNLQFGSVIVTPGVTKTVDVPASATPQSAGVVAAEFAYGVAGMSGIELNYSLPGTLLSTVGNLPLAITFNGTQYGGHCVTVGASACAMTNFNPTAGVLRVCQSYKGNGSCKNSVWGAGSTLHTYIGGNITVPPTQIAATYSGTITAYIVQVY